MATTRVQVSTLPTGATASTFLRGDGTWATPHEGSGTLHNSSAGDKYNVFPDRGKIGQIRWGRWKPHRLCGIEAKQEGKFTIQTVRLNGNELRFNYKCNRGGWINVELLKQTPGRLNPDAAGEPGFEFENCDRLTGNSLDSVVTWKGNNDISSIGELVTSEIHAISGIMRTVSCISMNN